ncbi:E3 ubiquitin-protein ligase UHRF1, partial [Leucoagaricus sp. SymC.cos]
NKELLKSLGLEKPMFEPKEKPRKKASASPVKRKAAQEEEEDAPAAKIRRVNDVQTEAPGVVSPGLRRSSRNAGKKFDYSKEQKIELPQPIIRNKSSGNDGPMGREAGKRLHDPKTYGYIPGIAVGTWWLTREACSRDAIHAPWVGGISGGSQGAHSVVLSGGYDDDVDLGYAFTYTGSGGRDLKGTKAAPKNLRTAPQSSDQTFENNFNKMLQRSCETKKPVRVVRGFKVRSKYAPSEGYRYDGLYTVEKAWLEKGLNPKGYLVCKFAFKRLSGQPPLPVNEDYEEKEGEAADTAPNDYS